MLLDVSDVVDTVEYQGLSLESKSVWIRGDIQDSFGLGETSTDLSPSIHADLALQCGWTGVILCFELRNLQMLESAHLAKHISFAVSEVDKTRGLALDGGWRIVGSERIDKR